MRVRLFQLGEVPPGLADSLVEKLLTFFQVAPVQSLELALESCRDEQRGQLDASCLLGLLPAPAPDELLLALVGADLFLPVLTYVFGASELGGRKSVLSWRRLRGQEVLPAPELIHRVMVESLHELGHGAGLVHCPVPDCAMHRSLWPEAIDLKQPAYCPSCLAQLRLLV